MQCSAIEFLVPVAFVLFVLLLDFQPIGLLTDGSPHGPADVAEIFANSSFDSSRFNIRMLDSKRSIANTAIQSQLNSRPTIWL
jgi:hypothetical protein